MSVSFFSCPTAFSDCGMLGDQDASFRNKVFVGCDLEMATSSRSLLGPLSL